MSEKCMRKDMTDTFFDINKNKLFYNLQFVNCLRQKMASNQLPLKNQNNSVQIEPEEYLDIPLRQNLSQPDSLYTCPDHSTNLTKERYKYINTEFFFSKNKATQKPFLCEICLNLLKKTNPPPRLIKLMKNVDNFQRSHINKVIKKYSDEKVQSIQTTRKFLLDAQESLIKIIDDGQQQINNFFNNKKIYFNQTFKILRQPFQRDEIQKLKNGQFDQKLIQKLCKSCLTVQRFSALIRDKKKDLLKEIKKSLHQMMDETKLQIQKKVGKDLNLIKFYIKNFQEQQALQKEKKQHKMVAQQKQKEQILKHNNSSQEKKYIQPQIPNNKNTQNSSRFLQQTKSKSQTPTLQQVNYLRTMKEKEKEENQIQSKTRPNFQSDQQKKENQQSNTKKIHIQIQDKPLPKHKIIHKDKQEKPSHISNVIMLGETYQIKQNKYLVKYYIKKAHTEKVGQENVNYMETEEFKRKYSEPYKLFKRKKNAGSVN